MPIRTAITFSDPDGWKLTMIPRINVSTPRISVASHEAASTDEGAGCTS